MQKGGYIIISITDSDIYNKLQIAMKINKPILFYENIDVCYFIDTISGGEVTSEIIDDEEVFTYHDIIMKKGSKTFTITSANAVSSEGEIQLTPDNFYPLLENIKDASGNLRFIEGVGEPSELSGVEVTYSKWSLSGTHLMIVLCCTIENGTSFGSWYCDYSMPEWIVNKVNPVFSDKIEYKNAVAYASDYSNQTFSFSLNKTSGKFRISKEGTTALTNTRTFRLQFDLLIDNEEEE